MSPGRSSARRRRARWPKRGGRGISGWIGSAYRLIEHSQERARGGRLDHVFTYEHRRVRYGEAPLRLKLEVSGDRLTEVTPFLKVPDAFSRRYAELRSANTTLATVAMALIALLYGLGGCLGGLVWLSRRRAFADPTGRGIFRAALLLAIVLSGLHFADGLDEIPQAWMGYDTAIAARDFWLKELVDAAVGSVMLFLSLFFPILAALGLSRAAFPTQPPLARAFTARGLASRAVGGRVLGAYLTVGFHFAFVVWIYRMGSARWGWWNPSDLLFHPDALAAPLPWLTSIANSAQAGIWEECLFRAVPLAGVALLLNSARGRRHFASPARRYAAWGLALLLQALIFGGGHATYPTQPAYARIVELIAPSFVFGTAYLGFGLIPGMLMHYLYDVALFAMPVFMTAGFSARVSQAAVVGVSGLPLLAVVVARLRAGAWTEIPEAAPARKPAAPTPDEVAPPAGLPRAARLAILGLAVLGGGVWLAWSPPRPDAPFATIARRAAIQRATEVLAAEGVHLGPEWRPGALLEGAPDEDDLFVWKTAGPARYRDWIGKFLPPPLWRVRWVRATGSAEERAEEYAVLLTGDGQPYRLRHELPEGRAGSSLEEGPARARAEAELRRRFGRAASELEPVSSAPSVLPGRRDWYFAWKDPRAKLEAGGEGRFAVKLSGGEVSYYRQYVEIPERWQRTERQRRTLLGIVHGAAGALAGLLALWVLWQAALGAVRAAPGRGLSMPVFWRALALAGAAQLILALNRAPERMAAFATSQPWSSQVFRLALGETVWVVFAALALATLWARVAAGGVGDRDGVGPALAGPVVGLGVGFALWSHRAEPFWAAPAGLAQAWPPLAGLASAFLFAAVAGFFVVFSQHRSRRAGRARAFALVFGAALGLWSAAGETWLGLIGAGALWALGLGLLAGDRGVVGRRDLDRLRRHSPGVRAGAGVPHPRLDAGRAGGVSGARGDPLAPPGRGWGDGPSSGQGVAQGVKAPVFLGLGPA